MHTFISCGFQVLKSWVLKLLFLKSGAKDRAGRWQEALALFDVATADIRSFNTALRAIAASGLRGVG